MTWTHQQVDEYLRRTVFPVPFGYLERTEKGKHKDSSPRRQWVLINKEKQRYETVPTTEPTGADLARYRGRQRCATKDANVIIGEYKRQEFLTPLMTYRSIPQHFVGKSHIGNLYLGIQSVKRQESLLQREKSWTQSVLVS